MTSLISRITLSNAVSIASKITFSATTIYSELPCWMKVATIVSALAIHKIVKNYFGYCVKTCDIDDCQVVFRRYRNGMEVIQYDKNTGNKIDQDVFYITPKNRTDEYIKSLNVRAVCGEIYIFQTRNKWSTTWNNFKITLEFYGDRNILLWKIFNKETNQTYWVDFDQIKASDDCCAQSVEWINALTQVSVDEAAFLVSKELAIEDIKFNEEDDPTQVVLKPRIVQPSLIDPNVLISNTKWITTMIIKGRSKKNIDLENHAQMLIERIKYGKHFFSKAHFDCNGVHYDPLSTEEEFDYKLRSAVIVADRSDFNAMIDGIKQEERDSKNSSLVFDFLGSRSLINRLSFSNKTYHNCATWVINKYKRFLKYDLGDSWWGSVVTYPRNYAVDKEQYPTDLPVYK